MKKKVENAMKVNNRYTFPMSLFPYLSITKKKNEIFWGNIK